MAITLDAELEAALNAAAIQQGKTAEALALESLRRQFLARSIPRPQDDWERLLMSAASECGVSLSNESLSSEGLYE